MKKIENCIGLYDLSKTLRFRAIPVGKTMENIMAKRILEEDSERAEKYKNVKKYMDQYHIYFIDDVLKSVTIDNLMEYADIFFKREKTDDDKQLMQKYEEKFRSQISSAFMEDNRYTKLFGKEMITELLPNYIKDEEQLCEIQSFAMFTTAFIGFFENRKNMYVMDAQSTAISYRCINENLPKFLRNVEIFKKVYESLGDTVISKIDEQMNMEPYSVKDCFTIDFFNFVLPQKGIDVYNTFLGGYVNSKGEKIPGLNEYINKYNQHIDDKNKKLPFLTPLYKQILSDRESASFVIEQFEADSDVKNAVINTYKADDLSIQNALLELETLLKNFESYNMNGIYISSGVAITDISNSITKSWSTIKDNWNLQYDREHTNKIKNIEKYETERGKEFNRKKQFTIQEVGELLGNDYDVNSVIDYYKSNINELICSIRENYQVMEHRINEKTDKNKLQNDDVTISAIKNYLDSVKELERIIKPLALSGKEDAVDNVFYGLFNSIYDKLRMIDNLYNKVRNYVTKKPYSLNKYKLYFENPQLLGGWDRNKEDAYRCTMLFKDGKYYLVIIDKSDSKALIKYDGKDEGAYYLKLDYKLLPGPNKMLPKVIFSKKNIELFNPSNEILEIYKNGSFKKGTNFNLDDCHKLIDFYKACIKKYESWSEYEFNFSDTSTYEDIAGFFREVEAGGYKISYNKISEAYVDELVEKGKIYLFQIYNKDFSEYSHGTENLHTMFFKMIFDEKNISNPIFKLSGGAELFMRPASIKKEDLTIHPKKEKLATKNPDNPKKKVVFEYDIIKDKRYSEDQFMLHIPIQINRNAIGISKFNEYVRRLLRNCEDNYVIGIDRGERNLLYVCVIDSKGKIVEQFSLNEIINEHQGVTHKVDYHTLLDLKEKERTFARQNWKSIENIKELKEGYIGQVVHKICQLVVKYDAVIAMEDLNSGFKRGRTKFEKQVYQKFEKMLIDKLNYMVDKKIPVDEVGGVLKGYQLTNKFTSFKEMGTQTGFIFYIPAWLTSKIDPTTGFADLLKPKYSSIENARKWIESFESIYYDAEKDMFAFKFDYDKFERTDADYRKKWTIYSNGERIHTYRNPNKNNEFDNEIVDLTQSFKDLFSEYKIDINDFTDLITEICKVDEKDFYLRFISLIKLVLQMRNSITGNVDIDYLISPVMGPDGRFYDSREYNNVNNSYLPACADANGAYNIARKVLWAIEQFKAATDDTVSKTKIAISNKEWLKYAQRHI